MFGRSSRIVLLIVALCVLATAKPAAAWGPATHVKIASDVLEQLGLLPMTIAALLARHVRDFLFGNIAADVVFAKRLSRVKQSCHRWQTGFHMFRAAPAEPTRAFALGYLCHLAADTVAHNKFLPRQMMITQSTMSFGHLYWEIRADSSIGTHYWTQLRGLLGERFDQHEWFLASRLRDTLLPFQWNLALFHRINTLVSRRGWIRTMDAWYHRSRWELPDALLAEYRAECVERALDVLTHLEESVVAREDPNGTTALSYTRVQRRQHRQMARAGVLHAHVLDEATVGHSPIVRNGRDRDALVD